MDQTRLTVDNTVQMSAADVEFAWHVVEPLIEAALARGQSEYSSEYIRHCLRVGTMAMWAIYDGPTVHAVVVTEIGVHPEYRVMRVVLLSGKDMEQWTHLEGILEMHARQHNCAFIEAWTRPGMAKAVKKLGYETVYHVIRKPVHERVH